MLTALCTCVPFSHFSSKTFCPLKTKHNCAIAMIWETEAVKTSREPFEWFFRVLINIFFECGSDPEIF